MKHYKSVNKTQKIRQYLELIDFSNKLMSSFFTKKQLKEKFKELRGEHLNSDYKVLKALSKHR
jgi:hypothetical protein